MARRSGRGEWRLYLRDHTWWWKWPLITTALGVWVAATIMFVAPWRSDAPIDDGATRPATTESTDNTTRSGDARTPTVATETARPGDDGENEVQSLSALPPRSVSGVAGATATTEADRLRSTGELPAPPPPPTIESASSPIGPDVAASTTTRPTTTTTTTVTTTTVRPTTTAAPTTTMARPTPTTSKKSKNKPPRRDRTDDDEEEEDSSDDDEARPSGDD